MATKDFLKQFRAAAWASAEERDAFVQEVSPLAPSDLTKLLGVLCDRQKARDPATQRSRIVVFTALTERALSPQLFVPFARALRDADAAVTAALVALMPRVNNVDGHADLCDVLGDEREEVRAAAAEVLGKVAGPRAVEHLASAVASSGFHGRIDALEAVAPRARHRALPVIAAVVRAGSPRERALALRLAGDPRYVERDLSGAAEVIAPAVNDPHEQVAAQAVRSLAAVSPEDAFWAAVAHLEGTPNVTLRRALLEAVRVYPSERTRAYLGRAVRVGAAVLRVAAIDSLQAIGDESVLRPLTDAIHDKNVTVKTRAVDALSELSRAGKVELARTIVWLLRSRDLDVRRVAVELARKVGDPSGHLVPKLLRLLRDEDWWVRERVMDALVELAGTALTQHVLGFLADPSDVVRRFAVGALRRIRDPRAVPALARVAMGDADWWVREEAVATLAELGDPRVVPYLSKLLGKEPDLALVTLRALQKLRARDAADEAPKLLGHGDADVRLAAVELVAELGTKESAERILAREEDVDARVRGAVESLRLRFELAADAEGASAQRAVADLDRLLMEMHRRGADDLLLSAGRAPCVKRLGHVVPLGGAPLGPEDVRFMLARVLSPVQRRALEEQREVDCSYEIKAHGLRFRVNAFQQMNGLGAVFRLVRNVIPNIDALGLPPVVKTFGDLKNGLVLVGGPTGAGKSTTLAALIDYINRTSGRHIVTIEDPIEVVHERRRSLVNQRENGTHSASFQKALRSTLRQDPDVILVGELRDHETIAFAVTAAETGHLVFGTVHTVSADGTIDRLLHVFPPAQRAHVRAMLSESLRAVVCQHLLRRKDRPGERVLAVEIMITNDAIANLIRKDKSYQIPAIVATSREGGMIAMDASLAALVKAGAIDVWDAYVKAVDKKLFEPRAEDGGAAARGG